MNTLTQKHNRLVSGSIFKSASTRPIGRDTTNRTINLRDEADRIVARLAERAGQSISDYLRNRIADGIESFDKAAAHAFRVAQRLAMLFFAVAIPALSFSEGDEFEARRPRRAGMCSRVCAHPARKPQVSA